MKKTAIITFDYEVFLGSETGTIENSVIKPTNSILKILKESNAKAIFFIDVTWLLFIRENFHSDFIKITAQLKNIIETGSSLELHLHPHWTYAYKVQNRIVSGAVEHYKIHSFEPEEILDIFKKSIDLLQNITNQNVCCFRAGGWCVEPFNEISNAFEKFGLKYDFSVVPGLYVRCGKSYDFDFSKAPKLPYYRFGSDIQQPDANGRFIEVPVSTYINNPAYRISNKILLRIKADRIFGDGKGIKEQPGYHVSSLINRLKFTYATLTPDKTSSLLFRYLIKFHFSSRNLLVLVSHPKTQSDEALKNLSFICRNYNTLNSADLDSYTSVSK